MGVPGDRAGHTTTPRSFLKRNTRREPENLFRSRRNLLCPQNSARHLFSARNFLSDKAIHFCCIATTATTQNELFSEAKSQGLAIFHTPGKNTVILCNTFYNSESLTHSENDKLTPVYTSNNSSIMTVYVISKRPGQWICLHHMIRRKFQWQIVKGQPPSISLSTSSTSEAILVQPGGDFRLRCARWSCDPKTKKLKQNNINLKYIYIYCTYIIQSKILLNLQINKGSNKLE